MRKGTKENSFCRWFVYYYLRNHTNEINKTIIFNNLPSMLQPYFPLITLKTTLEGIIKDGIYGDRRFQISQTSSTCFVVALRNEEKKKSNENVKNSSENFMMNDAIKDENVNPVTVHTDMNENADAKDYSISVHDFTKCDDGVNSDLSSNSDLNNSNAHSESACEEKETSINVKTPEEILKTDLVKDSCPDRAVQR
jgi:hypothetical protein